MNSNETLSGIKNFLKTNWFLLWISLSITTIVNVFIGWYIYASVSQIKTEIKESSKKVVGLSVTGQMIYAEKQLIDAGSKQFKIAVKNVLLNDLVVDTTRITQNFTIKPENEDQIVEAYEPLNDFYKHYLDKAALKDFVFFIREIGKLVSRDDLVEKAVPIKTTITRYRGSTKGFEIELLINCAVSYYLEEIDKNEDGVGAITIKAKGFFNPAKGDVYNPLGIKFTALSVSLVEKPRR